MPRMPKVGRTTKLCQGGGVVLTLVISYAQGSDGSGDRLSNRKATTSVARLSVTKVKSKANGSEVCRMFEKSGDYNSVPCKLLHDSTPADPTASSPSATAAPGRGSGALTLHAVGAARAEHR